MLRFNTINDTRQQLHAWRIAGERIVFVATMGNLHQGHLRLVEHARQHGDRVVVSIFVNPMQFNDKDDFAAYPNTLAQDEAKLKAVGIDMLFLPSVEMVYPGGHQQNSEVIVPGLSDILCGACRPGHFVGVATVVAKFFNIVQADVAVFGEKDFQQLMVIRRMVNELCFPVEIIGVPTERESDGLAMSSRNGYLSVEERQQAPLLYKVLVQAKLQLENGDESIAEIEAQAQQTLQATGFRPEYFSVRSVQDLVLAEASTQDLVIVAAAWLGKARLIDNIRLNLG
ncbi:MAG: pantoate--beta-alanine ligase [Gammaproteobacteria bacterium]|nr:pantoate--beta-alanine ligase [Gammaproteobacteria bacterium]